MGANRASARRVWLPTMNHRGPAINNPSPRRRVDRKLLQLCAQVRDVLNQVLSGECDDDLLRSLYVESVTPAPDATQLMVVVTPALPGESLDPVQVLPRLAAQSGLLRSEVASSITRRRAPQLLFQFSPGDQPPATDSE